MRVENWCGHDIRFIEVNGEWYAILKDICDALRLRTDAIASRLESDMLERVLVEASDSTTVEMGLNKHEPVQKVTKDILNKDISRKRGQWKTHWMLAVNELGIYEALFASRRLEARKFRRWSAGVMQKLRNRVGLEQYEVMRMTNPDIQEDIDHILDTLFYDEETGKLMQSLTVAGGDVEQVVFEGQKGGLSYAEYSF